MSENFNPSLPPNAQNPSFFPNWDQPSQQGYTTALLSVSAYLAANPQVAATDTIAVSGSATNADVISLVITNPVLPNGSVTVTSTSVTSDTNAMVAERLAAAINSNATLRSYNFFATSLNGVVTLNELGPVGNFTSLSYSVSGSATEILTFGNQTLGHFVVGGSETDADVVTVRFSNTNFSGGHEDVSVTTSGGEGLPAIATALKNAINADVVLAAAGITATVNSATVTVNQTGPNFASLSYTQGMNTETITFTSTNGVLAGGSGPIFPRSNFDSQQGAQTLAFRAGRPALLPPNVVSDLVNAGCNIM